MIEPALSAEEWVEVETAGGCHMEPSEDWSHGRSQYAGAASDAAQEGRLHRAAALCLVGQKFGFTGAMLMAMRDLGHYNQSGEDTALAERGLDNIEALLRPEARE